MQTEEQFEEKVKELIVDIEGRLLIEAKRLYNCGGIDPEDFDDTYGLPKIILSVALKNESYGFCPLSPDYKAAVTNLEKF